MICSLADFTSLPEGTQIPVCLIEGRVQYNTPDFTNVHMYTDTVSYGNTEFSYQFLIYTWVYNFNTQDMIWGRAAFQCVSLNDIKKFMFGTVYQN